MKEKLAAYKVSLRRKVRGFSGSVPKGGLVAPARACGA